MRRTTVALSAYDPQRPQLYAVEEERISAVLADLVFPYEHIGSTAVPGLAAKPIIDFMGGVASIHEARGLTPVVESLGYQHRLNGDLPERIFFVKGSESCRTHHFSLVVRDSVEWRQLLLFRDCLRADPTVAAEYAALKRSLAQQYVHDRAAYTAKKAVFISRVLAEAIGSAR